MLFAVLAVATGSLVVWAAIAARWRREEPAIEPVLRTPIPWGGGYVLGVFTIYLSAQIASTLLSGVGIFAEAKDRTIGDILALTVASGLGSLVAVAVGWGLLVGLAGADRKDLGVSGGPAAWACDLKLAALAFLAAALPVYAVQMAATQWIEYEHPVIEMLLESGGPTVWTAAVISAVVIAPIFEEFFFRLVIQGWLEKRTNRFEALAPPAAPQASIEEPLEIPSAQAPVTQSPVSDPSDNPFQSPATISPASPAADVHEVRPQDYAPIVISSLLFALLHLGQGPAPIPLFLLALFLGYLYRQTHRLLPCILMHALFNGYSLLMLWIAMEGGGP